MADLVVQSLDSTPPSVSGALSAGGAQRGQRLVHRHGPVVTWTVDRPGDGGLLADRVHQPRLSDDRRGADADLRGRGASGGTGQGSVTVKRDASAPTRMTFHGIKKKYTNGTKPKKKKV